MEDTGDSELRGAAFHEAGHVTVARFFGLAVGKIEIGEDGSGRAEIAWMDHLPLIDQIAVCVAGIEAQVLFRCPTNPNVAVSDYAKVIRLVEGLSETESLEVRNRAYLRALEILKSRMLEVEDLANDLIKRRRVG